MDDSGPSFPVFIPIVIVLFVVFAILACWYNIRTRRQRQYKAINNPSGPLQEEWREKLYYQLSLRVEQENDETKGSRVWFSRHIERGRFHHWILIINDVKYELRQNKATKSYFVNIASCVVDEERRKAALEFSKFPEYDGHYVCLIGWTRKGSDDLQSIAHQVGDDWDYSKMTNNCQHFLQLFSDRILESDKAADYAWFRENTRTEYQNSKKVPPTTEEIRAMAAGQQQILHGHHHGHRTHHGNHHHAQTHMDQTNNVMLQNIQMQNMAVMNSISMGAMGMNMNAGMNAGMNGGTPMGMPMGMPGGMGGC